MQVNEFSSELIIAIPEHASKRAQQVVKGWNETVDRIISGALSKNNSIGSSEEINKKVAEITQQIKIERICTNIWRVAFVIAGIALLVLPLAACAVFIAAAAGAIPLLAPFSLFGGLVSFATLCGLTEGAFLMIYHGCYRTSQNWSETLPKLTSMVRELKLHKVDFSCRDIRERLIEIHECYEKALKEKEKVQVLLADESLLNKLEEYEDRLTPLINDILKVQARLVKIEPQFSNNRNIYFLT